MDWDELENSKEKGATAARPRSGYAGALPPSRLFLPRLVFKLAAQNRNRHPFGRNV
jgi:hypothetical protein